MYGKKGIVHRENELMEISAVVIPAHRDAVALRGLLPDLQRHILKVEETEEGIVVTYAKPDAEPEDEPDAEAPVDEQADDDDDDDQQMQAEDEDEDGEEYADSDDEDEDEDEEEDEDKARSAPRNRRPSHDLMPIVRAALLDLIGSNPAILEPTTHGADGLASLFGIDK